MKKYLTKTLFALLSFSFFLSHFLSSLSYNSTNTYIGDQIHYQRAIRDFINGRNFYREGFIYFPSFFLLSPLVYNIIIYLCFLFLCVFLTTYLLFKVEKTYIAYLFSMVSFFRLITGNIDSFIFLIILLCFAYKNIYLRSFLLAFISFKPSVLLAVLLFSLYSEREKMFILLYGLFFCLFNFYFFLNPTSFFEFIEYIFQFQNGNIFQVIRILLRPIWLQYLCYYYVKNKN